MSRVDACLSIIWRKCGASSSSSTDLLVAHCRYPSCSPDIYGTVPCRPCKSRVYRTGEVGTVKVPDPGSRGTRRSVLQIRELRFGSEMRARVESTEGKRCQVQRSSVACIGGRSCRRLWSHPGSAPSTHIQYDTGHTSHGPRPC